MDKKMIAIVAALVLVVAAVVYMSGNSKKTDNTVKNDTNTQTSVGQENKSNNNSENMDTQNSDKQESTAPAEGYVPTVNGVKIEVLEQGTGDKVAKKDDMLKVHYTGTLQDGTVFDSSIPRNQPFSFKVGAGMVIPGWDQGLVGMKVGEKRKLTISPEMGYGAQAVGSIPANSTLIFEVQLLSIQ